MFRFLAVTILSVVKEFLCADFTLAKVRFGFPAFDKKSLLAGLNITKTGFVCQTKRPESMTEGVRPVLSIKITRRNLAHPVRIFTKENLTLTHYTLPITIK
jgi:hypothetical protein